MSDQIASTDGGQGAATASAAAAPASAPASTAPAASTGTQTTTAAPAAAPAPAASSWTTGLDEVTTGYVQNKGWDTPAKAIDSYRNLEKLLGADKANNAVIIPKPEADAKEWGAIYDRLGRPAGPEGYDVKFPDGGNKEAQQAILAKAHELGLTKAQAEGLFGELNTRAMTQAQAAQADAQARFQQEDQALRSEWGQAYNAHLMQAQAAAKGLGLDAPTIDKLAGAMGHKATLSLLQKIGATMGEDAFASADTTGFSAAMTPGQAKAQIQSFMADKNFVSRYMGGDLEAKSKMEALHKYAYPEG